MFRLFLFLPLFFLVFVVAVSLRFKENPLISFQLLDDPH